MNLNHVTNDEIMKTLHQLRASERKLQAKFLTYLGECDLRRLYLPRYRTMFEFLTKGLGYAESTALKRIQVARLARRFPEILTWIADGEVSMTNLNLMAPHAKDLEFLRRAKGLSKKQCEQMICQIVGGRLEPRDKVTPIAVNGGVGSPASANLSSHQTGGPQTPLFNDEASATAMNPTEQASPPPLPTVERVAIQFAASARLNDKLQRAKEVLRAKYPDGRLEHIVEEALDLLLDKADPERRAARMGKRSSKQKQGVEEKSETIQTKAQVGKQAAVTDSKKSSVKVRSRYIPAAVRREVWQRDQGCCQYRLEKNGETCGAKDFIEFDHLKPYALGGSHDLENITLICRQHNQWRAQQTYGFRAKGAE